MEPNITLKRTQSSDEDFKTLIRELDSELNSRYHSAQAKYDGFNKIEAIETVIVAYEGTLPVGCGCFKIYDSQSVEIKRMFVSEKYRGKGFSKSILSALEIWALALGYSKAILETGIKQHEAIGLYRKSGYKQMVNYGPYKDISTSVCFEKDL